MLLFMAVFFGVGWDSNDDNAIANCLAAAHEGGTVFQHKWLIYLLHGLYEIAPALNWWLVFSLIVMAVSLFFIILRLYETKSLLPATMCSLAVFLTCYFWSVCEINFTRTAAIAAAGGLCLITAGVSNSEGIRSARCLSGLFMMLLSAAIRHNVALLALCFLAGWGFCYFGYEFFVLKDKKPLNYAIPMLLLCAVAGIVFFSNSIDQKFDTEAEAKYREYNHARAAVKDYMSEFPLWEDAEEEYTAIGVTKNDLKAIDKWIHADNDFITTELFLAISKLRKKDTHSFPGIISDVISKISQYPCCLFLVCTALLLLILNIFKKSAYGVFGYLVLTFAALAACSSLLYSGRLPRRVMFSIFILYVCSYMFLPERGRPSVGTSDVKTAEAGYSEKATYVLVAAAVFSVVVYAVNTALVTPFDKCEDAAAVREECLDVLNADKENTYFLPAGLCAEQRGNTWYMYPEGYLSNVFRLGGWAARAPFIISRLGEAGISNPMEALLRDSVYSLDCQDNTKVNIIRKFLREHYDSRASYSRLKKLGNYWIIKYQGKIKDSQLKRDNSCRVGNLQIGESEDGYLEISAEVDGLPEGVDYVYCNVTNKGVRATYRVSLLGDKIVWAVLGIKASNDVEKDTIRFFYKLDDEYYRTAIPN